MEDWLSKWNDRVEKYLKDFPAPTGPVSADVRLRARNVGNELIEEYTPRSSAFASGVTNGTIQPAIGDNAVQYYEDLRTRREAYAHAPTAGRRRKTKKRATRRRRTSRR